MPNTFLRIGNPIPTFKNCLSRKEGLSRSPRSICLPSRIPFEGLAEVSLFDNREFPAIVVTTARAGIIIGSSIQSNVVMFKPPNLGVEGLWKHHDHGTGSTSYLVARRCKSLGNNI
jgi:hypothetical protein